MNVPSAPGTVIESIGLFLKIDSRGDPIVSSSLFVTADDEDVAVAKPRLRAINMLVTRQDDDKR